MNAMQSVAYGRPLAYAPEGGRPADARYFRAIERERAGSGWAGGLTVNK